MAVDFAIIWSTATIQQAQFTQFLQQPKQPDFQFKISGFLTAIKLTDKSGYPDNGYLDMQTLLIQDTPIICTCLVQLEG